VGPLRFPLIADPEAKVTHAYDAYKEDWKVSDRVTAVIGETGVIIKAYDSAPLDGKGHAEKIFADLATLFR
jgi:peroxiredoxin